LKNSVLRATPKFTKNFVRSCAQPVALVSRTELRQEVFSWELHYILVSTIRNRPQIANEKSTIFKTELFNRIGHQPPIIRNSDDRLLCEVYRPFDGVYAETTDASGGSCNKQPFTQFPGNWLKVAKSSHQIFSALMRLKSN
jgi:hypothetical protein